MILGMPKVEKPSPSHRNSISTASAAGGGGGTRSSSWSAKDDETLIQARAQGLNWNQIAPKHFPVKSANACRKRHERLMERQNAEQWDGVKLDVLAQAYMEVRREMWSILAARVGEKWQVVETKVCLCAKCLTEYTITYIFSSMNPTDFMLQCMEKGLKNLNQAYRSSQRKQGTYDGSHDDSGIGISDLDEESDDRTGELPENVDHFAQYPHGYHPQQQRVPSIQSILHPQQMSYTPHQYGPQH